MTHFKLLFTYFGQPLKGCEKNIRSHSKIYWEVFLWSLVTSPPRNILFLSKDPFIFTPDQKVSNFFAIFHQKKLLAGKTPKLQRLKKWKYWWFLSNIVWTSSKGLLLRLMYGLIFLLTEKTNFFYLWSSFAMKFSPKVKKTNFHKNIRIFQWKNIFLAIFQMCTIFIQPSSIATK